MARRDRRHRADISAPRAGLEPTVDPSTDPYAVARGICLRLLTGQPRTRAQLAQALHRRAVPAEAAEAVLDRLTEAGLINDPAFARAWVDSRHVGRSLGRRVLVDELRRRGVDADIIAVAVEPVDAQCELDTARALVRRRLPSTSRLTPPARLRRLLAQLERRGYSGAIAAQAIREVMAEPEAAELLDTWLAVGAQPRD